MTSLCLAFWLWGIGLGPSLYTLLSVYTTCEDTLFLLHSPIGSSHVNNDFSARWSFVGWSTQWRLTCSRETCSYLRARCLTIMVAPPP